MLNGTGGGATAVDVAVARGIELAGADKLLRPAGVRAVADACALPAVLYRPFLRGLLAAGLTLAEEDEVVRDESEVPENGWTPRSTADWEDHHFGRLCRHPLLSPEDEQRLGRVVQRGLLAASQLEAAALEPAVHAGFEQQVREGRDARNELVRCNMRLVANVAKRYVGRGLLFEDLLQEGVLGLIRAAEGFDPHRELRFSTYAVWWIRQSIQRGCLNTGYLVRIPVHQLDRLHRLVRVRRRLEGRCGREATAEELAEALDEPVAEIEQWMGYLPLLHPVELDRPLRDGWTLAEVLASHLSTEGPVMAAAERQEILDLIAALPDRERTIIELRYGLLDREHRTLDDVGRYFGLTRERIRQLEKRSIETLRRHLGVKAA